MARWFLLGAIVVEVLATSLMPATDGFTRWAPTALCLLAYAVSFTLFARALQVLPVGLSYAVWSGVGTISIVVIGMLFLDERHSRLSLLGVGLVLAGVLLIHLSPVAVAERAGTGALPATTTPGR